MTALALRWIAALVLVVLTLGAVYTKGAHDRDLEWQRQAAAKAAVDADAFAREVRRGDKAVANLTTERLQAAANYRQLAGVFDDLTHRIPLLARRRVVVAAAPRPGAAAAVPAAPAAAEPAVGVAGDPGPGSDELSAAALRMWNGALAGTDIPAGACGPADASDAACAAASGVTLADAWHNHAVNAQLCAIDRINHRRLIDYIQRQQPQELPAEAAP